MLRWRFLDAKTRCCRLRLRRERRTYDIIAHLWQLDLSLLDHDVVGALFATHPWKLMPWWIEDLECMNAPHTMHPQDHRHTACAQGITMHG